MSERPEVFSPDRRYLSTFSEYSGLRSHMAWGQSDEEGGAVSLHMQAMGPVVRRVADRGQPLAHRDTLPLLADAAAMASLGYESVPREMSAEYRRDRARAVPLAREIFLKTCERLSFEGRGSLRTRFVQALDLLLTSIDEFSRELDVPTAISRQLARLEGRASGLRECVSADPGFMTTIECREGLSRLQHDALEGMGVYFDADRLHRNGDLTEERFSQIQDAFLKMAKGARVLLEVEEALRRDEQMRLRTPQPGTTWSQGGGQEPSALNQASAAWRSPTSGRR